MHAVRRLLRVRVIVSVLALLVGTAIGGTQILAVDGRLDQCMASGGNIVLETFDLASSADYKKLLPRMGDSPELEEIPGPAFIVIFEDSFTIGTMMSLPATGEGADATVDEVRTSAFGGVVCVLVGDTPFLYADVDTSVIDRSVATK